MLGLSWRFLRESAAIAQGLRIKIYEEWQPELDEFLESLPEQDIFPHELFRLLMKLPNPGRKQIILVKERGEPVALAGVRNRGRGWWEPVSRGILPGMPFPVKEGYLGRVLPALGLHLHVLWWGWPEPHPIARWMRQVESYPTHNMRCSEDFEAYWRRSAKFFKTIRTARDRCRGFEFKVNSANSAEWIIKSWDQKWCGGGIAQRPDLLEILLAAEYLQKRGLYHSHLLLDGDEPVAGATVFIHRNEALAHINYRNPEYDRHGGMTRLLEMQFCWAKDMGFRWSRPWTALRLQKEVGAGAWAIYGIHCLPRHYPGR